MLHSIAKACLQCHPLIGFDYINNWIYLQTSSDNYETKILMKLINCWNEKCVFPKLTVKAAFWVTEHSSLKNEKIKRLCLLFRHLSCVILER